MENLFGPSYQQQSSYPQQPYGQQQSMFGSMFSGQSQKLNPQTIGEIARQLQQQGVSPKTLQDINEVLNEMVNNGTERVSNVLKQYLTPELAQLVLTAVELEGLEEDMGVQPGQSQRRGMQPGRGMGMQPGRGMGMQQGYGTGMQQGSMGYGGKKRRTRRRKQRGGNAPYAQKNLASNAEGFKGGRRRKTNRR